VTAHQKPETVRASIKAREKFLFNSARLRTFAGTRQVMVAEGGHAFRRYAGGWRAVGVFPATSEYLYSDKELVLYAAREGARGFWLATPAELAVLLLEWRAER